MSYCVNCGVKLEASLTKCPLCHTPVLNPNELEKMIAKPSPYPVQKGTVEEAKKRDVAILTIVVLLATSLSCFLLNLLVFQGFFWSFFIIGACSLLFALVLPLIIHIRIPYYLCILFDGIATAFYLFLISFTTASKFWFFYLALPIVCLITILVEIFALLLHIFRVSVLTNALFTFIEIALLCCGLEVLIDRYCQIPVHLTWSAIILTICTVISITLGTILSKARLRESVRRRLHF